MCVCVCVCVWGGGGGGGGGGGMGRGIENNKGIIIVLLIGGKRSFTFVK